MVLSVICRSLFIWLFGACVFSFINVLIYRVPKGIPFIRGHSICPVCGGQLSAMDLIPVVSWLFLKGRCRYCQCAIPVRDTWIEIFGGGIALLCVYKNGVTLAALTQLFFLAMLTAVAIVDLDTMEIPNGFILALFVIGLCSVLTMPGIPLSHRLLGMVSVSGPLLLLSLIISGGFGGGDIKLTGACGVLLGWRLSVLSLAIAVLTGGVYGMYLLVSGRKGRKEHLAFGPFLSAGMLAALFWGDTIINTWLNLYVK